MRNESICLSRDLYMNVYSSFIGTPKLQTTQMCISTRTNKEVWYIHTVEYYSVRKINNKLLITCSNKMDLKKLCWVKKSRPKKKYMLYDFTYIKLKKILDYWKKAEWWLSGDGKYIEGWGLTKGHWGVMDMLTSLIMMIVSWMYTYIKKYEIVHV